MWLPVELTVYHMFVNLYTQVNEREDNEQKVNCADFYIPEITEHVDIKTDYVNWYHKSLSVSSINLSNYHLHDWSP